MAAFHQRHTLIQRFEQMTSLISKRKIKQRLQTGIIIRACQGCGNDLSFC
jgi:hypothetical protein